MQKGRTMEKHVDAKFVYFKVSGKYYSDGLGVVPDGESFYSHNGFGRDACMAWNGGHMPGLGGRGSEFVVIILPSDSAEKAFPIMWLPE